MKPGTRSIRKHFGALTFAGTTGPIDIATPLNSGSQNYTIVDQATTYCIVYEDQKLDMSGVAAAGLDVANLGTAVARSTPPQCINGASTIGFSLLDGHYISMKPFEDMSVAMFRELMLYGTADESRHEPESMLFANVATFQRSGGDLKAMLTLTGTNNWALADLFSADRLYYRRILYLQTSGTPGVGEDIIVPPSFASTSIQLVKQEDNAHLMTMAQSYELHQA